MKKIIALLLALTFVVTVFAGCSQKKETLVVGLDDQFPPMGFRDDNNDLVGLDIDLIKAVGEKLGVEMELQPINWKNKFLELDGDNVDILWNGLTITDERKEESEMSRPYLANRQIIVVTKDSPINTKADLKDKIVAVQTDSTAIEALEKDEIYSEIKEKREFAENVSALADVEIGRVDALVVDEVVGKYYLTKQPDKFKILEDSLAEEEYGFAVKKGNTELLERLQKAFDEVVADGTASEISIKWFGEDKILK